MLRLSAPALDAGGANANLLLLGVTPEIVQLAWPGQVRLLALDRSDEMISWVWRPNPGISSAVQRARWQEMPVEHRSMEVVVGDGSLNVLERMEDYPEVLSEVARVLKPGGLLVVRCFVRPDERESLENIMTAALAGEIESFHALKWRIAMASSDEGNFNVDLRDVFASLNHLFPDRDVLAKRTGWLRESVETIDAFDGVASLLTFPTLSALFKACAPYFEPVKIERGHYELAECCPTIAFRPRGI